jgi:hypothetical protein
MKKLLTSLCAVALISALSAGFVACDEPQFPEEEGVDIPFVVYTFAGNPYDGFSGNWVNLDYERKTEDRILVINSEKELREYVEGDYPPVNFRNKTLVVAYGYDSGLAFGDDVTFNYVSGRDYLITASGMASALVVMVKWEVAIVTDKLPSGSNIKFNGIITNLP